MKRHSLGDHRASGHRRDFRLVNTYGAFGRVGRERHEVIVEGTDAEEIGPDAAWREYGFKGREVDQPPRWVRALFRYRFTSWAELRRTGAWWTRTETGPFVRPFRLPEPS